MIADAVYLAITGIGFCHAAGRSIISSKLRFRIAALMPKIWTRSRRRSRI
jgi:hypothetical protein